VKVLIAGATGHFGGLIAGHLVAQGRGGELVVTSRTLASAQRLRGDLDSPENAVKITGRVLDVASLESGRRAVDGCALCIDAAGPYQARDGTLVRACAEAGCDYLDSPTIAGYSGRVAERRRRPRSACSRPTRPSRRPCCSSFTTWPCGTVRPGRSGWAW